MTHYLLDTSVLLRWLDASIAEERGQLLADRANEVSVSAASVWEISIKRTLGKLRVPDGLLRVVAASGFRWIDISAADGLRAGELPLHHRDPFDRMIIAHARELGLTVITDDRAFEAYEVDLLDG